MLRAPLLKWITGAGLALLFVFIQPIQAQSVDVGCSTTALIDAITNANLNNDTDTLTLTADCVYTFTAGDATNSDTALPYITSSIIINGNGATLQRDAGAPAFRLLTINGGVNAVLKDLTVQGGFTPFNGGGILNVGTLTLINSAVIGNDAILGGGGIYNQINATLINTMVSGNHAGGMGGGVYNGIGSLNILDSTIAGNSGGLHNEGGDLTAANSIVWGNNTQITTGGGTLTVNYSVIEGGYGGNGNLDVDPLFVNLVSYTLAPTTAGNYHLVSDSPAINAGNNDALPADAYDLDGDNNTGEQLPYDYDGEARVVNSTVDIGADEIDPCLSYTFPYTVSASEVVDLIQAVKCANISDDVSVINLTNSVYTLTTANDSSGDYGTSGLPLITTPITINGDGATLQRDATGADFRVIRVATTGNLTLDNITISGGKSSIANYKVGGGILNQGTLTLNGSAIIGNTSPSGGGIYNDSGASMTITDTNITGNTSDSGGGLTNWGTLTIKNSLIQSNTSTFDSGGLFNGGPLTMVNTTVSSNTAVISGAMRINSGAVTILNSTFAGNTGTEHSGAISRVGSDPVLFMNCLFTGNTTPGQGGAFLMNGGGGFNVINSTIVNNSAGEGGAFYNSALSTIITNSILWGNGTEIVNDFTPYTVTYSDIEGGYNGTGNLNVDPQFVDTANGDYHLQDTSPLIDTGSNAALPADTADLDGDNDTVETVPYDYEGNTRVQGNTVDPGMYESAIDVAENLVSNGGFETAGATDATPADWTQVKNLSSDKRVCNTETKTYTPYGDCAFRFKTKTLTATRSLKQVLPLDGLAGGDVLSLSLNSRSKKLTGKIQVMLQVYYSVDSAPVKIKVTLPTDTADWQTLAGAEYLSLTGVPVKVQLVIKAKKSTGQAYLDEVIVNRTAGASITTGSSEVLPLPLSGLHGRGQ